MQLHIEGSTRIVCFFGWYFEVEGMFSSCVCCEYDSNFLATERKECTHNIGFCAVVHRRFR